MSGNKRYTYNPYELWIIDNKEDKEYYLIEEVVDLLNEQEERIKRVEEEIARQKYTKHIMRDNIKSYEKAIKQLRKSYDEFDEMRLNRIRFLEKKLKKNGLSIYVNDCEGFE